MTGVFNVSFWQNPPFRTRTEPGIEGYNRRISAFPYHQSLPSAMLFTKIALALALFTLSASACIMASDCDIGCGSNPGFPITKCQEWASFPTTETFNNMLMTVVVQFAYAARPLVQTVEHYTHRTHLEIDTDYLQTTDPHAMIDSHHISMQLHAFPIVYWFTSSLWCRTLRHHHLCTTKIGHAVFSQILIPLAKRLLLMRGLTSQDGFHQKLILGEELSWDKQGWPDYIMTA